MSRTFTLITFIVLFFSADQLLAQEPIEYIYSIEVLGANGTEDQKIIVSLIQSLDLDMKVGRDDNGHLFKVRTTVLIDAAQLANILSDNGFALGNITITGIINNTGSLPQTAIPVKQNPSNAGQNKKAYDQAKQQWIQNNNVAYQNAMGSGPIQMTQAKFSSLPPQEQTRLLQHGVVITQE